ncbi:hypothetical protein [Plantibacter sp. H53]|uniref:hypothetical protein n=1 Tax=Plantibacter sp. H53 TaxID=1827323 RepID=UPI000AE63DDA|nr:hypothetical protein [Plantibacter sp. H53]
MASGSRLGGVALLAALLMSLTACTPPPQQPQPYPDVRWDGGAPTEFADSEWVMAVRASLEAQAVARNRNDFTIEQLVDTTGPDLRDRLSASAVRTVSAGEVTRLLPGPWPFTPVVVDADGSGKAEVTGCLATKWANDAGTPPPSFGAVGITYRLEQASGSIRVMSTAGADLDCSQTELPVGVFDPAPTPSGVTSIDDIVRAEPDAR